MRACELAAQLGRFRFRFSTESELQNGVAVILSGLRIEFEREVLLSRYDRIDFLVGDVGIEVKIAGGVHDLLRQCGRYLQFPRLSELIVVCSAHRLAAAVPPMLCGKPTIALNVRGSL